MKLPMLENLQNYPDKWIIDDYIEYIFGFPQCRLTLTSSDEAMAFKNSYVLFANMVLHNESFMLSGSEIITSDNILKRVSQSKNALIRNNYTDITVTLSSSNDSIDNIILANILQDVEYMTAIIEYCIINGITIPNQERIVKYCSDNDLIDKLNLSKDHMKIIKATLEGNHRL